MFLRSRSLHAPSGLALLIVGTGLIGLAVFLSGPPAPIVEITPRLSGQPERCLSCHAGIEPISASHPTEDFGCVSCHGGERLALRAETAHKNLVVNPGALDVADKYCGSCHTAQVAFVPRSIMATYAGAIGLVRRMFGLQPDDTAHFAARPIDHLAAFTVSPNDPPLLQQFAERCMTCHLHAESQQADYYYRSTGCSTCHVLYADDGLYRGGDPTIPKDVPGHPARHEITKAIPYTQCNHCHNRGNYDLRTMTFLARGDLPAPAILAQMPADEARLRAYYQPIGQFTLCEWELDCIDCHTSKEVMGDGVLHNTRGEAQYIRCAECHGTLDAPPAQVTRQEQQTQQGQHPSPLMSRLRPATAMVNRLVTSRGEVYTNTQLEGEAWVLTGKVTGKRYTIPLVQGSQCQQKPEEQASHYCHKCHTYDRSK